MPDRVIYENDGTPRSAKANEQSLVDAVASAVGIAPAANVTPLRDESSTMKGRPMANLYSEGGEAPRLPSVTADSHDKMSAALVRVCADLQTLTFRDMMTLCDAVRGGLDAAENRGPLSGSDVAGAILDAAERLHPPGQTKSALR